jgi:DNA-binding CsgD family transcriptional regulator
MLHGDQAVVLVGRAPEVAGLDRWLEAPGDLRVMAIEGDPGAGRTALWRHGVDRAGDLGHRVLAAGPASGEAGLDFAALGDLLAGLEDWMVESLPPPQRLAVRGALLEAETDASPRGVAVALLTLLRRLARDGPVLLAIDDVHWLDEASAQVLRFALRRLREEPVSLLLSRWSGAPEVPSLLDLPPAAVGRIRLGPLGEEDLGRLLRSRTGGLLAHPAVLEIHHTSAGNPARALELGHALTTGEIRLRPGEPLPPPATVVQALAGRLESLSAGAREALLAAATAFSPSPALVEALVGEAASEGLREAAELGLVELSGDDVRFRDSLVASHIYWAASPERRRALHGALAAAAVHTSLRLRYRALSSPVPAPDVARELEAGTIEAVERGAVGTAGELAQLAMRLTPPAAHEDVRRRRLLAAELGLAMGAEPAIIRATIEESIAQAPPGRTRADMWRRLALAMVGVEGARAAIDALRRCLWEAGDERVVAAASRDLALACHLAGDQDDAATQGAMAVDLASAMGEPKLAATALAAAAAADCARGDHRYRARLDGLTQVAGELGPAGVPLDAALLEAQVEMFGDDLAGARERLVLVERRARQLGHARLLPIVLGRLAEIDCWLGRWEQARSLAGHAQTLAEETGQPALLAHHHHVAALAGAHLGDVEGARRSALRGEEIALRAGFRPWAALNRAVLGHLELALGNPRAAYRELEPLLQMRWSPGPEPGLARLLADAIEAMVASGDLQRAAAGLCRLEAFGRWLGARWPLASAARCKGLLEASRGGRSAAPDWLSEAADADRGLSRPLDLGRDLLAHGMVLRRRKNRAGARQQLQAAHELFGELRAPLWTERARVELSRLGGLPRSRDELTPTQRRIAELVARGQSNREVADTVFLTVHTVEDNLRAIYRKLGIHSRAGLAQALAATDPRE